MDGVHGLDVAGHIFDPLVQVVARVVGDVVVLGAVRGGALDDVELGLGARLVHQVVPEDGRVLPAVTTHQTFQGADEGHKTVNSSVKCHDRLKMSCLMGTVAAGTCTSAG